MNPKHVPTLKTSQTLNKLLIEKGKEVPESLFRWSLIDEVHNWDITMSPETELFEAIPAYLSSESGEAIAKATDGEYTTIQNEENTLGYRVYEPIVESEDLKVTRTGYKLEVISNAGVMNENEAECRALLYIYLLTNDLI